MRICKPHDVRSAPGKAPDPILVGLRDGDWGGGVCSSGLPAQNGTWMWRSVVYNPNAPTEVLVQLSGDKARMCGTQHGRSYKPARTQTNPIHHDKTPV